MVWDRLYRLKQRGVTLVLTTHYMDEAEQLCDRLVVMDKAKIVAEGSPRELIERYSTRDVTEMRFKPEVQDRLDGQLEGLAERVEKLPDRVLLYSDDGEAAAVAAHERGLRPETVLVRRSTLEDVFLRLTGRSLIEGRRRSDRPLRAASANWADPATAGWPESDGPTSTSSCCTSGPGAGHSSTRSSRLSCSCWRWAWASAATSTRAAAGRLVGCPTWRSWRQDSLRPR
jgi:hypothetical protein